MAHITRAADRLIHFMSNLLGSDSNEREGSVVLASNVVDRLEP